MTDRFSRKDAIELAIRNDRGCGKCVPANGLGKKEESKYITDISPSLRKEAKIDSIALAIELYGGG